MTKPAICVRNLGKHYQLGARERGYTTFRETLIGAVKAPFERFRRLAGHSTAPESFWALKDVSFDIEEGEVVGIIGRNGAGKSTLLKILSQITEPTTGKVELHGRVGSLLEVGTGFHPELTGRENVYLNGSILGMKKREIKNKFDEIVAFSGVDKFLDTPVKRYSSGMQVRLAFSVAAHLEPEILVVDEVLAVGDLDFQKKCLGKMGEVAKSGRTVLFVSHNTAAVKALCTSAILLANGELIAKAPIDDVIDRYLSDVRKSGPMPLGDRVDRTGTGHARFFSASLANSQGRPLTSFQCGSEAVLLLDFMNTTDSELQELQLSILIENEFGQRVLSLETVLLGTPIEKVPPGLGRFKVTVPRLPLIPGHYGFTIYLTAKGIIADWIRNAWFFDVESGDFFGTGKLPLRGEGLFLTDHNVQYECLHSVSSNP